MEVINDLLGYDGIKIIQDSDLFSFSIDSLLLANFATIGKKTNRIVDLCTGNGPIPLYLTLRTKKPIIGVELQTKAYDLAVRSLKLNNIDSQITYVNRNLIGVSDDIGKGCFDLVLVNPPYFKYTKDSNINDSEFKTIARHEVMCNLEDVIKESNTLLNNGGYLAMVHRPERLDEIFLTLKKYHLTPKRLRLIYPKRGSKCNHILIEARKTPNGGSLDILSSLYVHDAKGVWTKEVLRIYNKMKE